MPPFCFGPKLSSSLRFFSNTGAVAGTFSVLGIEVALVLLMIYVCHRRYRRDGLPQVWARRMRVFRSHARENPPAVDPFAYSNPPGSATATEHKDGWGKHSFLNMTDEHPMEYMESGPSTQGLGRQRNDVEVDALYGIRSPRLAGMNPGIIVNYRDRELDNPKGRQVYRPKPRPNSYGKGPAVVNHSLAVTSSRAFLPFPYWQPVSEAPPSQSIYSTILPVAEDDNLVHQLPTPTSIAYPKATAAPYQSYNWGASARRHSSYMFPVNPETSMVTPPYPEDDDQGLRQKASFPGPRQSYPPPIPPRNPLRRAMSMQTILDVSSLTPSNLLSLSGHTLTNSLIVVTDS
ncbi:hypothetical protein BDM02DRAFT_424900 [Thelephora ganbajun]|uniref:Uncharacterized protein n=1 Tax=Thelephora ganbajun TaxID=370292 RepID=A0ACB6ZQM4_THEGA|nr:hypothetical protein BDM02DRAFT_424900 [Thelephora ganbajun]